MSIALNRFAKLLVSVVWCVSFAFLSPVGAQPARGLLREVYLNLPGAAVSDLTSAAKFPAKPDQTGYVTNFFEAPTDILENYGQRLRGYLLPPVTGNYTFWIATDDGGELWLSTDDSVANRKRIARVDSWTPSREWSREANQQSAPIRLEAGRSYYVEALMKEQGGGDNLAVRWLRPDGADEGPIPGNYLLPWGVVLRAPEIVQQPANATGVEGGFANFSVLPNVLSPSRFQWQRNGADLTGATDATLIVGPLKLSDQGAKFRVRLTNNLGSLLSQEATLTVTPDTTAPSLVGVFNEGPTRLQLTFSESMALGPATLAGNYRVNGGVSVSSAIPDITGQHVTLTVSGLVLGEKYTLTLIGLSDAAGSPNPLPANTTYNFTALEYTARPIGTLTVPGQITRVANGQFNLRGGGTALGGSQAAGGTSDQFQFASELRTGDFDIQTRIEALTITDPFAQVGLVARSTLDASSPFAAVLASSPQLGTFFTSRTTTGSAAARTSIPGGFPVNYPEMWLRLRRVGNSFTGFAGWDGQSWVQLGSATLNGAPATLHLGLAAASMDAGRATEARFRNIGNVTSPIVRNYTNDRETPGPFVRSSGLVVSEIMYHPKGDAAGRNLEFVELYNAGLIFEDLTGMRLSGEVEYLFPDGFRLEAGAFVVVAANPAQFTQATGTTNVFGPYTGSLANEGGKIELFGRHGDRLFSFNYETRSPWPTAPDGSGHSLALVRPSFGPNDPRAWSASERIGGSPGGVDYLTTNPHANLVINEFLAHTDDPQLDYIELYNRNNASVDISGCILTDDPSTNRFRIPNGTSIAGGRHAVWNQNQLGFRLNAAGETLWLLNPDGSRVLDVLRFGAQENGVSTGRQPDGAPQFRRLESPTPESANNSVRRENIVINEIMFQTPDNDSDMEYVELYNRGTTAVDLSGWEFTDGIEFRFPGGSSLPASAYAVVGRNVAKLRSVYPNLNASNSYGDYSGSLDNRGERLALAKPDFIVSTNSLGVLRTNIIHIDVAEVFYRDGASWARYTDGGGSSLELIDPHADGWRAANWAGSDESGKATWTQVELKGRLDNGNSGFPPNQLQVTLQGGGEALIDNVEVYAGTGVANLVSNGGFETGSGSSATGWTFQGNHSGSIVQNTGAFEGGRCLKIQSEGRGDTGFNRIRTPLTAGLADGGQGTIRARVRWLAGWPEILFRFRGNWFELPAKLTVPNQLGTPGAPNSRRVANAGPAIFDVSHFPALPANNQPVTVTVRIADPDGISIVRLVGRVDGGSAITLNMLDDGAGTDAIAGDGIYSTTLTGRPAGTLVAFQINATDSASSPTLSRFPSTAPKSECLVRWGDPVPLGTLGHYHMWSTAATESARGNTSALNNQYRDLTFVYGNQRIIYGCGFKDKGSPFHGGGGDFFVSTPNDQPVLDATDLALASTGNTGSDNTQIREQVSFYIARAIGSGYLYRRFIQLYRNGGQFRDIMEDTEEPNGAYSERFESRGDEPDLYKIEDWFEFQDDGTSFSNVDATLQKFTTPPGAANAPIKVARYRWSWRKRAVERSANEFTNLVQLVEAVNAPDSSYSARVSQLVDVDQWMRTFVFERIVGNWDAYGMGRGKNMYAYKRAGVPWKLFPWDVDFTLDGGGNGPTDALWGAGDPTINRMFDHPPFRRLLWQAYIDAINGPLQAASVAEQVDVRTEALHQNGINAAFAPGIKTYLATRRQTIINGLNAANVAALDITSNGGNNINTTGNAYTLTGRAPLGVRTLTVNGAPFPVTWTDTTTWRMIIPLTQATNRLLIAGEDPKGNPVPGASDSITIVTTTPPTNPGSTVVINEIQYDGALPGSSFIELHNTSASAPMDLSEHRLDGVSYTFREGAVIAPNGYMILARDRAGFALAYGNTIPVFGDFSGNLDNGGERLCLIRPDPTGGTNEIVLNEVRFDNRLPWPTNASGFGPSLQLIDPLQDTRRVANWTSTATNAPNRATPGARNSVQESLTPFQTLWINEVLPDNVSGATDNFGEREPWIELYNSGPDSVDLSNLYLSADLQQLTAWKFPNGTTLATRQFLIVWTDGEAGENAPGHLHTSFRLPRTNGVVLLSRIQGAANTAAVLDYIEYGTLAPGRSLGDFPDGNPMTRRVFQFTTAAAPNNPAVPEVRVTINEFMAGNDSILADPADGDFDDWIELYNAGSTPVDLSGYFLTDNLTNWNQFRIPLGHVLPPGGYLLAWADGETGQNSATNLDLHTNFRLALAGEQLGLFDPNGVLIDGFTFGSQTNDIAQGRFPNGSTDSNVILDIPTPKAANVLAGGNRPPQLNGIGNRTVSEGTLLQFTASASDPDAGQVLTYSLGSDAAPGMSIGANNGVFTWTPSEAQGPGSFPVTIRVSDNGLPSRSGAERIVVSVNELNRAPLLEVVADREINEGALFSSSIIATDPDSPANKISYQLLSGPPGLQLDPASGLLNWTPVEAQGPGIYAVQIRATDDGNPTASAETTFRLTVREVDNPPNIVQPQVTSVDEGQTLILQISAQDPDQPAQPLRYSLGVGAPAGASLNPTTGELRWTTSEVDGPKSYTFPVTVSELGGNQLSTIISLTLHVAELNQHPILAGQDPVVIREGSTVRLRASATDADLPPQILRYSLDAGAPAGASMDPVSGDFVWPVPPDTEPRIYPITVRATDDGPGTLSATATWTIRVESEFRVVINEVMRRPSVTRGEYIEIYNTSAVSSWNLGGLRLTGLRLTYEFPADTILTPNAVITVAQDAAVFRSIYGAATPLVGAWTGNLDIAGDNLRLIRPGVGGAADTVLDEFRFEAAAPWPAAANGGGASLQLVDARRDNSRPGNWSTSTSYSGPRDVLSMTNEWRYYQLGPLASNWKNLEFNDSTWASGRALHYVETAALPARTNTPLTLGQNSYYFRTQFVLPSAPSGATLALNTIIDDGAVFYLNGQEIFRQNIDTNAVVDFNTPASLVSDATLTGPFTIGGSNLREGINVLAVEVHQVNSGSSDIVFGCSLRIEGGSVAALTPGQPNNVVRDLPEFPKLRITEVVPTNATGRRDAGGEIEPWFEVANLGDSAVPLEGWFLSTDASDITRWSFPAGALLNAGEYRVIVADSEPGESTASEWHSNFRPVAANGLVLLSRSQPGGVAVVDYLRWGNSTPNLAQIPDPNAAFGGTQSGNPTPGAPADNSSVNRPPVLGGISNQSIEIGQTIAFSLQATDPDPGQSLNFRLISGPPGLAVTPNGSLSWIASAAGSYSVQVAVEDNGTPKLTATAEFGITVTSALVPPVLRVSVVGEIFHLHVPTVAGGKYQLDTSEDLSRPWQSLVNIDGTGQDSVFSQPINTLDRTRFYRARRR